MSKMGISLLSSYHGAQIFEAIGIGGDLLNLAFRGTPSRLGGMSTEDLASESASFLVSKSSMLDCGGVLKKGRGFASEGLGSVSGKFFSQAST